MTTSVRNVWKHKRRICNLIIRLKELRTFVTAKMDAAVRYGREMTVFIQVWGFSFERNCDCVGGKVNPIGFTLTKG